MVGDRVRLLDVVVDGYFDAVQAFDDYYDEVSDSIFSEHPLDPAEQRRWFDMRRAMVRFHRLAVPLREAVSSLMRREHAAVTEELYPYYQDVYDHILRISESSDSLRDLVSTIVETNLSLRDYHQNQIVKKVTSWAAIIAVPTLITGYYGMNVPYPGSGNNWGVVVSAALVAVILPRPTALTSRSWARRRLGTSASRASCSADGATGERASVRFSSATGPVATSSAART